MGATSSATPSPGHSLRARLSSAQGRGSVLLLASLALLTVITWALTIHQSRTMDMPMGVVVRGGESSDMAGMPGMAASGMAGSGWSLNGATTFVFAWGVMMAAMMFPAAAPMLLLFHTLSSKRRAQGKAFVSTWIFAAGYLLVWSVVGLLTWFLVQLASELAGHLGVETRNSWRPIALGTVLIVAGLYQLTPIKRVCLDHCRSPFGFVMTHWREGRFGALRMGVIHGGYCLGCCWALFAVLVAAGVMSLAWMALLTLIVFAEKVLPLGRRAPAFIGSAFLVLGVIVAAGTVNLPWVA
jgi:predicted metal-binding membrane protein